jgi:group I intron endonuclease
MKQYGIIYKLTNTLNGKAYVGQTTQELSRRIHSHKNEKRNRHISNAIHQYGFDNFLVEILVCSFSKEALNEFEAIIVEQQNTMFPAGYNHRAGGNQNGICSEELKKKISQAKKGKPNMKRRGEIRSIQQRLSISRTLGGKFILGTEIKTGRKTIFNTAHQTADFGFQPWNVIAVCKGRRNLHKGFIFEYYSCQSEVKA